MLNDSSTSVAQGDFDQSLNPITSYDQGSSGGAYSVREGDTLAGLAERLWGDASLWWKIAEANGLTGQAALVEGQALTLPAGVMRATHNAQTFQPYDPSETIGDTAPTTLQPTPKKNKCGVFGRIFLVVIAAAVAFATQNFLVGAKILAKGSIALAAVSTAAGSIVSQGVGVATGIQDKFSWNAVALSALSAGVGARFGLQSPSGWGQVAANSAAQSIITQGIGVATGLQDKFDWTAVAAAAVGGGVGYAARNAGPITRFSANLLSDAAVRTLIDGTDFGDNLIAALPSVLGQTIGSAFAGGVASASKQKPLTAPKIELFAPIEKQSYTPLPELAEIPDMPTFEIADDAWRSSMPVEAMQAWANGLGYDRSPTDGLAYEGEADELFIQIQGAERAQDWRIANELSRQTGEDAETIYNRMHGNAPAYDDLIAGILRGAAQVGYDLFIADGTGPFPTGLGTLFGAESGPLFGEPRSPTEAAGRLTGSVSALALGARGAARAFGSAAAESLLGQSFGKLGTVVENPGLSIAGVNNYAAQRALQRGMTIESMNRVVSNPAVVLEQSGGKHLFLSNEGVVVLNQNGRVVTTYSRAQFDQAIESILRRVNGGR